MELMLSICIGIGLSAACGYRVFVPLLGMGIAAASGHITLPDGYAWIGSGPAVAAFALAAFLEIAAYYIPFVDNVMDTVATPAAVIAGAIAMSSVVTDVSPFLKWSLAIIAGGGTAALFQGSTTLIRSTSTVTTAGMGNFAVSTIETGMSLTLTLLAFILPFIAGLFIVTALIFLVKMALKKTRQWNRN